MSEIFDYLNKNSGALSAIFSAVVTGATVVYAWLTARLVEETRQMRQAQTEPRIQVTYRVRDEWINLLDISVRNIGLGPAYDVRFKVHTETTDTDGSSELVKGLLKLACFKNGLSYLGPSQEYFSYWTNIADGESSKVDCRIIISCSYRSVTNAQYKHDCIVDLSELKGSSRIGEPPLHKIAKHIEKIEKDLHNIATGYGGRLKVDIFDQADRIAERAETEDRFRRAKIK